MKILCSIKFPPKADLNVVAIARSRICNVLKTDLELMARAAIPDEFLKDGDPEITVELVRE